MIAVTRVLRSPIAWALLLILVVMAFASVFTVVPETQQAVVVRMGTPRAVINLFRADQPFGETGAGLIAHVPLLDQIVYVDRREQTLEADNQPIVSTDGRQLEVHAFARYRVVDPTRLYLATRGDPRRITDALKPALQESVGAELSRLPAAALLAPDRTAAMQSVAATLDQAARKIGARVSEVRLDRVGLADGAPLDGAIGRMRDAREGSVAAIRNAGNEQVATIRVQNDAAVSKIYADAFGQDPDFYEFYRAMNSYEMKLGDGSTQFVLSPDSDYLRQFRSGGKP